MSTTLKFSKVLGEWTGVLMRQSTKDLNRILKDYHLSISQLSTLMRLYFHETCGVTDIGIYVGVTNAAASQMVDRLVKQGLLDRIEDIADRRGKKITLTPRGRELIQRTMEARRKWMEDLTILLSPDEQDDIIEALTLMTAAARKLEQSQPVA